LWNVCRESFQEERATLSFRVNTLKTTSERMLSLLRGENISVSPVSWCDHALILAGIDRDNILSSPWVREGLLYSQNLSSLLPALVLDPRPGDRVLDMCAAPGSKATHMAALMGNEGEIVCLENIRNRYFKLKAVIGLLGAKNIHCRCLDARRYRDTFGFDRVLVDAPCSSEGRFRADNKKTFAYWSPRKVKEMCRKQRGLLLTASRLLKSGGTFVYSTCTFAPEENEGVVDWLLKKTDGRIRTEPIVLKGVRTYPALRGWGKKTFAEQTGRSVRVLPAEGMEGFFIAKFKRCD